MNRMTQLLTVPLLACTALSWAQTRDQRQRMEATTQVVLEQGQVSRGLASVCGADSEFVLELVKSSELLVHVRDPRPAAVQQLRTAAAAAGIGIDRLVVEEGTLERLPYADNMIDLLVTTESETWDAELAPEALRVLRPRGTALLGKALASAGPDPDLTALETAVRGLGVDDVSALQNEQGSWLKFTKPPLSGADDWSHWEHSPDNNPVSADTAIRAPYLTQYLADPKYIGMPAVTTAAAGRTFLAIGHISHHRREWDSLYKLIARNGYNGTVLWERSLPEGYLVHRSAFIATPDVFYMIDGDGCLLLDPATGAEMERLTVPEVRGEWKWMVIKDGILYVMAGDKERGTQIVRGDREVGGWSWDDLSPGYYGQYPYGYGKTLFTFDLSKRELVWRHDDESKIDSRSLAMRDGNLYFLCPAAYLRCLDASNGELRWENTDRPVRDLIAEPGRGLRSTPGFKTMSVVVATPDALIIQGQTRMNVVAVSTKTGYQLWTKRKITNNPNAIYVDGKVVLGVGQGGSNVVVDPVSGNVEEDLKFRKVNCTRVTASGDSFFCRGEGTLRFDRETKRVIIDGGARPGCNDGALPANGMLYIGPWQCDCNLSLIGCIAKCSAGDFRFDFEPTDEERLTIVSELQDDAAEDADETDWPTFRGDVTRSSATRQPIPEQEEAVIREPNWTYSPVEAGTPTPPVSAWGNIYWGSSDGKVRAVNATDGELQWEYATLAPIKAAPTLWEGRLYVGSGDGYVYCIAAKTGKLLWRFQAAPVERHIMVYGHLTSTWPVNTGVTIHEGTAYFGAGIIDEDGTYVYGLDAKTGRLRWHNNKAGHLSADLRKGVSIQGNMTVLGEQLLLAGGNQVSPAPFDLRSGKLNAKPFAQGQPKANNGQFAGSYMGQAAVVGGRVLYSAPDNVATKGRFVAFTNKGAFALNNGGIPPAWDEETTALVNFKHGSITCFNTPDALAILRDPPNQQNNDRGRRWYNMSDVIRESGKVRWETNLGQPNRFEAVSMVVSPNAVLAVVRYQQKFRAQPQWYLTSLDGQTGKLKFQHELRRSPLPGGLLVDRDQRIVVTMLDGSVIALR